LGIGEGRSGQETVAGDGNVICSSCSWNEDSGLQRFLMMHDLREGYLASRGLPDRAILSATSSHAAVAGDSARWTGLGGNPNPRPGLGWTARAVHSRARLDAAQSALPIFKRIVRFLLGDGLHDLRERNFARKRRLAPCRHSRNATEGRYRRSICVRDCAGPLGTPTRGRGLTRPKARSRFQPEKSHAAASKGATCTARSFNHGRPL